MNKNDQLKIIEKAFGGNSEFLKTIHDLNKMIPSQAKMLQDLGLPEKMTIAEKLGIPKELHAFPTPIYRENIRPLISPPELLKVKPLDKEIAKEISKRVNPILENGNIIQEKQVELIGLLLNEIIELKKESQSSSKWTIIAAIGGAIAAITGLFVLFK